LPKVVGHDGRGQRADVYLSHERNRGIAQMRTMVASTIARALCLLHITLQSAPPARPYAHSATHQHRRTPAATARPGETKSARVSDAALARQWSSLGRAGHERARHSESSSRASRGRLAAVIGLLGGGFRACLSRPRRGVLRGRGLGLLERDGGAPFRGMDSAQRAELAFLRFAQRRLVRPPLARVIAPSEKRQHGKRNRDERDHVPSYHAVPTM
jgi:hypothetical protein